MRSRPSLDSVDLEILRVLAEDCSVTVKDLAARVGVSVPSARKRLRRLRSLGVLGGCWARVDPEALGASTYILTVRGRDVGLLRDVVLPLQGVEAIYSSTARGIAFIVARVVDPRELEEILSSVEELGLRVEATVLVDSERRKPWTPREPPRSVTLKCAYCGQPIIGEPYTVTLSDGATLHFSSEECATAYFLLKHRSGEE